MEPASAEVVLRPIPNRSPRLSPEDFRAAFTTAAGWGTFEQKRDGDTQTDTLRLHWGRLRLTTLGFDLPEGATAVETRVQAAGRPVSARCRPCDRRVFITMDPPVELQPDQTLVVTFRLDGSSSTP